MKMRRVLLAVLATAALTEPALSEITIHYPPKVLKCLTQLNRNKLVTNGNFDWCYRQAGLDYAKFGSYGELRGNDPKEVAKLGLQ